MRKKTKIVRYPRSRIWHVVRDGIRTRCCRPLAGLTIYPLDDVKPSIGQVCRCCFHRHMEARASQ